MNNIDNNLSLFFNYLDDLILIIDKNNHIIHYNNLVLDNLGYSSDELKIINAKKLFPDNIEGKLKSYFNDGLKNKIVNSSLISKNGTIIPAEIKFSKGVWNGENVIFAISGNTKNQAYYLFETAINAIKEWAYVIDKNLEIIFVNKSLLQIHRQMDLPLDVIGKNIREIYKFLPENIFSEHESTFKTGKEIRNEYTQILKGRTFNLESKITPIFSGNKVTLALITLKDITEQKEIESELRKNEKRFRDITFSMGDFVWEMDENGVLTYLTEKLEKIMGYHPEEVIGKSLVSFLGPDNEESKENFNNILTRQEPILDYEFNIPDKHNHQIWLLIYGVPIFDKIKNFKGYRGVAKDITELKIEHEKLTWNQDILKLVSESSLQGLYFVDNKNDKILFFNKRFCELWGIEDLEKQIEQGIINNEKLLFILSEKVKDSELFLESFKLPGDLIHKLKFENEYLLVDNRNIYSYSAQINDDNGQFIGRVYFFEEISFYKIYDSIVEKELDFNELINQAPDAIVITDHEANIQLVNSAAIKLLVYPESELLKMNITDVIEPTNLLITPLRLNELDAGKTLLVERFFLTKDGNKIRTEVRVRKIQGNRIFAIIRDLSDRDNRKLEQISDIKSELLKKLYVKLKSFKHGEDSAMILNRISLFTRNIKDIWTSPEITSEIMNSGISKKIENLNRAKSLADEFMTLSYPQLKHIVSLIEIIEIELADFKIIGLSKININDLKRASEFLKNCFDKFLESTVVKIEVPEQYKNEREILESVKSIKKSLIRISKIFENYFLSDLREEIYFVVNKYTRLHHNISISFSDFSNYTQAIVNNDELKEILTILFTNSMEALSISDVKNKRINICLRDTETRFIIEFENNGICIEENLRNKLFTGRISTKGEERGFGLNYARNCLLKYGGNINIDDEFDRGTRFIIELTPI